MYAQKENDHLDIGLAPGPESPLERNYRAGLGTPVFKLKATVYGLPRVYEQINARLASFREHRSTAVWNPWTGEWRVIRPKPAAPSGTPGPRKPGDLPERFYVTMAQLGKLRDDSIITDGEYRRRVDALLKEYIGP